MTQFETVRRFEDAARRCALSTHLLADIGVIEDGDLPAARRRRWTASVARRLGFIRAETA